VAEEITITADATRPTGTRASRRLRAEGKVPAVLYGHGTDPKALAVDARALRNALTGEAGLNALITLQVDGDSHLAMARQLQRHPVKGSVDHVDFVIVRRDEVVSADVPIQLVGDPIALHNEDGIVDQQLFNLPIKAKPLDIPGSVEVDISELTIGDAIRVGDLKLPSGVETEVDPEEPVVLGSAPQVVELPEEAVAAEGEEGEEGAEEGAAPAEGEAPPQAEEGGGQPTEAPEG